MGVIENIKDKQVGISIGALLTVLYFVWTSSGKVSEVQAETRQNTAIISEVKLDVKASLHNIADELKEANTRLSKIEGYLRAKQNQ